MVPGCARSPRRRSGRGKRPRWSPGVGWASPQPLGAPRRPRAELRLPTGRPASTRHRRQVGTIPRAYRRRRALQIDQSSGLGRQGRRGAVDVAQRQRIMLSLSAPACAARRLRPPLEVLASSLLASSLLASSLLASSLLPRLLAPRSSPPRSTLLASSLLASLPPRALCAHPGIGKVPVRLPAVPRQPEHALQTAPRAAGGPRDSIPPARPPRPIARADIGSSASCAQAPRPPTRRTVTRRAMR